MWGVLIAIILVVFLIIVFSSANSEFNKWENKKREFAEANAPSEEFRATTIISGIQTFYSFAIDQEKKKIMVITAEDRDSELRKHIIDFSDIISVELLKDSNVSYSKSTMRTIGGGIVGGVIAGGAGAIVGGLSGGSKEERTISNISVKLLLRNLNLTSITMECLKNGSILDNSDSPFIKEAQSIIDHVSVIIDLVDKENGVQKRKSTSSIADELEKLYALKEKGILTEEEFQMQKNKLLS